MGPFGISASKLVQSRTFWPQFKIAEGEIVVAIVVVEVEAVGGVEAVVVGVEDVEVDVIGVVVVGVVVVGVEVVIGAAVVVPFVHATLTNFVRFLWRTLAS